MLRYKIPMRPATWLSASPHLPLASSLLLKTQPRFAPRLGRKPANNLTASIQPARFFSRSPVTMGVTKHTYTPGSGAQPKVGQTVTIEYTGYLKDASQTDNKGKQFDSSKGRGDFVTKIGVGQVIKGWDEGVTQMQVGEKARLEITSDYGYGARGFPGHIPPNSDLIFDVELKGVN